MIRLTAFAFLLITAAALPAQSLIDNGGFEKADEGWFPAVPSEAKAAGPTFTIVSDNPHSGGSVARLYSESPARHGFTLRGSRAFMPVAEGERYRITAWVRVDAATVVRSGSPGPLVRLTFLNAEKKDTGACFLNTANVLAFGSLPPVPAKPPLEWTKLEAVVEIPVGTAYVNPFFFGWYTQGSVYFDDIALERVTSTAPLTPLATN